MNKVIDIFAGAGGFSTGFEKQGFKVIQAIELEKDMADTLSYNHKKTKVINDDIRNVKNSDIMKADVLIGGPPCQGFSMAGSRVRDNFLSDERNFLFREYIRVLKQSKPRTFVFENVPGIKSMENGDIFKEILKTLKSLTVNGAKYKISHKTFDTSNFNVPQRRRRTIIFGSLDGLDIRDLKENVKKTTIWDAISDLENIDTTDIIEINGKKVNGHFQASHTSETYKKIKMAHDGEKIESNSKFSGAYKVMPKYGQAKTLTTRFDAASAGEHIHPTLHRTITPREAARIQTFPDSYVFLGNKSNIRRMIGNAVPVNFASEIAKFIKGGNDE